MKLVTTIARRIHLTSKKSRDDGEVFFGDAAEDYRQAQWLSHQPDFANKWRYDHSTKTWHGWNGFRWAPDETGQINYAVALVVAKAVAAGKAPSEAKKLLNNQPQDRALRSLATFEGYGTNGEEWDSDIWTLGVANGIVDLRNGTLIARPTSDNLVTKTTGIKYRPDAECPRFLLFLYEIYGADEDMVAFMRRLIGSVLIGKPTKEFPILLGDTDTGKTTLIKIIDETLGDYSTPMGIKSFARSKQPSQSNSHTRDLMRLPGTRFAFAVESDDDVTLDEARIKAMTGGEAQLIAAPYSKKERLVDVTWALWFGTNTPPKVRDESDATWNRMQPVPHDVRFWKPDDVRRPAGAPVQDPDLLRELMREREGILRMFVQWAKEFVDAGERLLPLPQSGNDLRTTLKEENAESTPIDDWFEMEMERDNSGKIGGAEAWEMYKAYRKGYPDVTDKMFWKHLGHKATTKAKDRTSGVNYYFGIRAKTIAERG